MKIFNFLRTESSSSVVLSLLLHIVLITMVLFIGGSVQPGKELYTEVMLGGGGGRPGTTGETKQEPQIFEQQKTDEIVPAEKIPTEKTSLTNPVSRNEKGSNTSSANSGGTPGSGGGGGGEGTGITPGVPQPGLEAPPLKDETWYTAVEEMPEASGGISSISLKAEYTEQAKLAGVTGTVYILAFIEDNGIVQRVVVAKGLGYGLDESAMKAVKKTRFKPGRKNGKLVRVQLHIPVTF